MSQTKISSKAFTKDTPAGLVGTIISLLILLFAVFIYTGKTIPAFFFALGFLAIAFVIFMSGHNAHLVALDVFEAVFGRKHRTVKKIADSEVKVTDIEEFDRALNGIEVTDSRKSFIEALFKANAGENTVPKVLEQVFNDRADSYERTTSCLEYVANIMPLFGLIGTLFEMLAIFGGLDDNISMNTLAPQIKLAFSCTMWGAVFSAIFKICQSRVQDRLEHLERVYDRMENNVKRSGQN